jgi:aryl-alcohol dehydrogenase-like predicted oxidoreductase
MTFGEAWGWGADASTSRKIFDAFAEAGGTFVDTSSNYTNGQSESLVGEFVAPDRDHFVVATKYSLTERRDDPNFGGNHRKNLVRSLEGSLRRLGTDHVDVLYLHMWDYSTSVEEVLRAMDDMVRAGKVLHVGFSDTPAWTVAQAVTVADLRGWTRPTAIQGAYSALDRGIERDLLPMARALGLAVTVWGVLEGGVLTGKYADGGPADETRRYQEDPSDREAAMAAAILRVAGEVGCTPAQAALAWARQRGASLGSNLIPIVGARTEVQLRQDVQALDVALDDEQVERLSAAGGFQSGFPQAFLASDHVQGLIWGATADLVYRERPRV